MRIAGRANALIDLNRDGNVDWLHERPGVAFEFGDGKGNFKPGGHLEVAPTRNEINMHSADFNGDGFIDLAVIGAATIMSAANPASISTMEK